MRYYSDNTSFYNRRVIKSSIAYFDSYIDIWGTPNGFTWRISNLCE